MNKKIFFSLIICSFLTSIQAAYAICASKIIFVQDDSQSVNSRIAEANNIATALINAVGIDNFVHMPISRAYELGEEAVGATPPSGAATGWGYSLPNLTLTSAVERCDQGCTVDDGVGRNYKCAIVYWGDNVITHKNPNMAIHDYNALKKAMDDTHSTAINSSHRFFINLSFISTNVDSALRQMSTELYDVTQAASYRGIEFRPAPHTGSLTDIDAIVAAILDRFGHSE